MFKLVRESLEPLQFQRGLDPKEAMGIGKRPMIKAWLDEMGIEDYIINDDYTIDVDGHVILGYKNLDKFPNYIQFGKVKGYFVYDHNKLTSLRGSPKYVRESFWCDHNKLTTLEGAPEYVGGNFWCSSNELTTLEGAPKFIRESFFCDNNQLTTLEGVSEYVGKDFWCHDNAREFTVAEVRSVCKVGGAIYV